MPASPRQRHSRALVSAVATVAVAVVVAACGSSSAPTVPKTIHLANTAAAAVNPVTVSPLPGTGDASPSTQISFLGSAGTTVSDVHVTGSHSGGHDGKLEAYSTGTGESFMPDSPFTSGERVTVTARVTEGGHASSVKTSFAVAFQPPISRQQFPAAPGDPTAVQHYLSAPSITPSTVHITTPPASGATPGDLFLAPYQGKGTPGEMIVDQTGSLVWFHPVPPHDAATNFRVQRYRGKPVLTWWEGRVLGLGFGQGHYEIYDTSYRRVARVSAGNGYLGDLHEFLLTPQGTAWIDAFDPVDVDLSAMGGSAHGVVSDSVIEEIDIKTGLVMWEWHALGHVPLRDSFSRMPHTTHPWDYMHVNSLDPGTSGELLISARNTWIVGDLNMHTGAFIWRIGGRFSDYKRGTGALFYWQHDAEWQPGGLVSVFDNGASPTKEKESRGLLLRPDARAKTVTLTTQFTNPNATLLATSQGNLLSLHDGNWLMGYGGLPNFTEYDSSGHVLLDGTLGRQVQDFRTYLAPWSGQPRTLPSVAAQAAAGGALTVEASWNGATVVRSWKVLAGASAGSMTAVASAPKDGFETQIAVHSTAPRIAVAALDASGNTLATSRAIAPSS